MNFTYLLATTTSVKICLEEERHTSGSQPTKECRRIPRYFRRIVDKYNNCSVARTDCNGGVQRKDEQIAHGMKNQF